MPPRRSSKSDEVSVKSSLRTLQLLEYCDSLRRGLTIAELADGLSFPQSSTSTLVQSMINAGYLIVDPTSRRVFPSSRVAALGAWIEPSLPTADIHALMARLGEKTGLTILLGVPSDLCVRYIHTVPGRHAMRLDIPVGARLPLTEAGMGRLLLSELADTAIKEIWTRARSTLKSDGARGIRASEIANRWNENPVVSPLDEILAEVAEIRRSGYALSLGRVTLGAGILCVPMPRRPLEQPIGLGIGGLSEVIQRDTYKLLALIADEARRAGIVLSVASNTPKARRSRS
jgi:IclR family acetate operon transcriptional repressor